MFCALRAHARPRLCVCARDKLWGRPGLGVRGEGRGSGIGVWMYAVQDVWGKVRRARCVGQGVCKYMMAPFSAGMSEGRAILYRPLQWFELVGLVHGVVRV